MPLARTVLILSTLIGVIGCSSAPQETEKGKSVKVIKSPFAETCIQLGLVRYDGTPFIHEKELSIIMKELAAQMKGNAVRYDIFTPGVTGVSNAKGRGTAFKCQRKKLRKYLRELNGYEDDEEGGAGDEADDTPATPKSSEKTPAKAPAKTTEKAHKK
ncbi:MAG: hypothetical protein H7249_08940 [Chitinophagaceae bacterium]|nr:hypothetical protein [Oligoflexus sp.]